MRVGPRRAQHGCLRRWARLAVGSRCRSSVAVEPVENGCKELLSVPYRIFKRDPAALDIRLIQVDGNGRHVADLTGEHQPTDDKNGTDGEQDGSLIPFHSC